MVRVTEKTAINALLCAVGMFLLSFSAVAKPTKLILQITVDQMRGDMLDRYGKDLPKGGFRYLQRNGVIYKDAHHAHANNETVVGHATLATGAHPAQHGLIGNVWFDRQTGRLQYNVEDGRYPLLSADADVNKKTEIDPTQKVAASSGRSPASMLVSSFSDELYLSNMGKSKIFAVSVKDRGAITLAGHAGKAFWFSKKTGTFVTSSFYYPQYPAWVSQWNEQKLADKYAGTQWTLLRDKDTYLFSTMDDQPWEIDFPGFGRTFPHKYGDTSSKYFYTLLTLSPAGDALTLDFAKTLLKSEKLGQGEVTDYLSVSFSSTDYVGHFFGPSSLESEDNLLRLDRVLAELFDYVDDTVGLRNTLIVLSADHGAPEVSDLVQSQGTKAENVDIDAWNTDKAFANLQQRFGVGKSLIKQFYQPYIYLDRELIAQKGLDPVEVEQAVATEVAKLDGVAMAYTASQLTAGNIPDDPVSQAVMHNHNPNRSGDVYVVFESHRYINKLDGLTVASMHGSPWRYDSHVPIIFAGHGIKPQTVHRRVHTVDLAPTLAAWAGTKLPSAAAGEVLEEVIRWRKD